MRDPSSRGTGGIAVSHPSRVLVSYQAALALQEAGLLRAYHAGFYAKVPACVTRCLAALPDGLRRPIERELSRRIQAGLDPARVKAHGVLDVVCVLAGRMGATGRVRNRLLRWRNDAFDAAVAGWVRRDRPQGVIAHDASALLTFRACAEVGALRILDQVIGHMKIAAALLAEESRRHPEFADAWDRHPPASLIHRCTAEALGADRVLAPSEYVRQTLIDIGVKPERILLLPYGVDVERFRPVATHSQGPFRILFVGQISQRKGVKYLLEAYRMLKLRNAELILMGDVTGTGSGLAPYAGSFTRVHSVPYGELHHYYPKADVFVFPSLLEGSALAVYEAMACGVPVVTTPNAGSVVRDGQDGYIVPIRDAEALADRIVRLYDDPRLREEMGKNARARAESFTWAHYRRKLGDYLAGFAFSR